MFLLVFIEILTELSTYLWVTLLSVDLTRFFILEKLFTEYFNDFSTQFLFAIFFNFYTVFLG